MLQMNYLKELNTFWYVEKCEFGNYKPEHSILVKSNKWREDKE